MYPAHDLRNYRYTSTNATCTVIQTESSPSLNLLRKGLDYLAAEGFLSSLLDFELNASFRWEMWVELYRLISWHWFCQWGHPAFKDEYNACHYGRMLLCTGSFVVLLKLLLALICYLFLPSDDWWRIKLRFHFISLDLCRIFVVNSSSLWLFEGLVCLPAGFSQHTTLTPCMI